MCTSRNRCRTPPASYAAFVYVMYDSMSISIAAVPPTATRDDGVYTTMTSMTGAVGPAGSDTGAGSPETTGAATVVHHWPACTGKVRPIAPATHTCCHLVIRAPPNKGLWRSIRCAQSPTTTIPASGRSLTVMRISPLLQRISGTYIAWPSTGRAWKRPGTSARRS